MRKGVLHKLTFISKSLLWSLLFYFVSMAIINWDEMLRGFRAGSGDNVALVQIIPGPGMQPTAASYKGEGCGPEIKREIQATGTVLMGIKKGFEQLSKVAGIIQH